MKPPVRKPAAVSRACCNKGSCSSTCTPLRNCRLALAGGVVSDIAHPPRKNSQPRRTGLVFGVCAGRNVPANQGLPGQPQGEGKAEGAALTFNAAHRDLATHHVHQTARNGQSPPGTAKVTGAR